MRRYVGVSPGLVKHAICNRPFCQFDHVVEVYAAIEIVMAGLPRNPNKETPSEIYAAVGEYLSQWESLETQCAILFGCLLQAKWASAVAVYSSIQGFHNRRKALIGALDANYDEEGGVHKKIAKVLSKAVTESKVRNDLAHGQLHKITKDEGGKAVKRGHFVVRPSYNVAHWPLNGWPNKYYTAAQIRQAQLRCKALRDHLEVEILEKDLKPRLLLLQPQLRGLAPRT